MKNLLSFISIVWASILVAQEPIELKHITDGTFRQKSVRSVNWMNDGQFYSALSDNQVIKYDVTTGEQVTVLVNGDELDIILDDYSFSDDESKVLLMTNRKSIYRRSFTAKYHVFDISAKDITELSTGRQSYATFSPNGSKVAFARENNLFYTDLTSKE